MSKLTRRAALGLGTSVFGLAACGGTGETTKPRPAQYDGKITFAHGVASGDPMSDSVILWTRVTPEDPEVSEIPVYWYVTDHSSSPAGDEIKSGVVYAKKSSDWCVKVEATDLLPDHAYSYFFQVETTSGAMQSDVGKTRTTSKTGDREIKLAFVSCSNFPFGHFNAYEALSKEHDLDAIIHLGDYLYEYGPDGYGGETGAAIGRPHNPPHEIITLDDYRTRHAQYKTDPKLQMAHAAAPWICTWDDHESANDSYRTGAENHNEGEGSWSDRKQAALQAYMEWMPVREPGAGKERSDFWRRIDFGDVASIFCLETRLTGRSEEISWAGELGNVEPAGMPFKVAEVMTRVQDPERTMLGAKQEKWLADELKDSVKQGKPWQVLANQTVMARVRPPNFTRTLSDEEKAAQEHPLIQRLIPFSQLGLPLNLDAWDGFPAARERLYKSAKEAGATLVTLTGDTHTSWVNLLADEKGERRGVEFGCTSVTSPGFGEIMTGVEELGKMFEEANEEVQAHRPLGHGYSILILRPDSLEGHFFEVDNILSEEYESKREMWWPYKKSDFL